MILTQHYKKYLKAFVGWQLKTISSWLPNEEGQGSLRALLQKRKLLAIAKSQKNHNVSTNHLADFEPSTLLTLGEKKLPKNPSILYSQIAGSTTKKHLEPLGLNLLDFCFNPKGSVSPSHEGFFSGESRYTLLEVKLPNWVKHLRSG